MERITKGILQSKVTTINEILKERGINKVYEIGYRNGYTYIDQLDNNHKGCIVGGSICGSKKEISDSLYAMLKVIY